MTRVNLPLTGLSAFVLASLVAVHFDFLETSDYDTLDMPDDVYFLYLEGNRILHGVNPYARVLEGDMRKNNKYATYLPGSYLFSAAMQRIGNLEDYDRWLIVWRYITEFFYVATGVLLVRAVWLQAGAWIATICGSFWFFGRWSLAVIPIVHLEPMAIFFMVAGWLLFRKHRIAGLLLFGCSLAIKQVAVFLIPLFLIHEWNASIANGWKKSMQRSSWGLAAMLIVPFLLSIPFILRNADGFFSSIMFSATRTADTHFQANSIDVLAGSDGLAARLPMLIMMGLIYWGFFTKRMNWNLAGCLVILAFIQFNSVMYIQYMIWTWPFIILVVSDLATPRMALIDRKAY